MGQGLRIRVTYPSDQVPGLLPKLKLNFGGRVTRVPKAGCIFLTTAFEQKFYIEAGPHGEVGNSEWLFPAWLVQEEGPNLPQANLIYSKRSTPFSFSYKTGTKLNKIEVTLETGLLTPNPFAVGSRGTELVRKEIPSMISKSQAKAMVEPSDKDKEAQGRIGKRKAARMQKADKAEALPLMIRHLFR